MAEKYYLQARYLGTEWEDTLVTQTKFPSVEAAEEQIKLEQEVDKKFSVSGFEYRVVPVEGKDYGSD